IVGPDVDEPFEHRRLIERHDVAQGRRRLIAEERIGRPDLAHDRNLVAIEISRQVGTDLYPVVAAIVAAIEEVAAPVQTSRRVRTDDVGRVPVCTIATTATSTSS